MKEGIVTDHAGQFTAGDPVFITRYGENPDWGSGAILWLTYGDLAGSKSVPAMPQYHDAIFVSYDAKTNLATIRFDDDPDRIGWLVPIGFVKTRRWVEDWEPKE